MTTLAIIVAIIFYIYLWVKHRNIAITITAIPITIGLIIWGWYYYTYVYPQKKVGISLVYDEKECGKDFPLRVSIKNNSNNVIKYSSWNIGVYKPDFSSDLSNYSKNNFNSDKIIKPKESFSVCCIIPTETKLLSPETYMYKIEYYHFTFE